MNTTTAGHGQDTLAPRSRHGMALGILALVLALWLVALALALAASVLPDETSGTVAVVFPPGASEARMHAAVLAADGALLRDTRLRTVWVVHGAEAGFAGRLRAAGAWQVFSPIAFEMVVLPGCVPGMPLHSGARMSRQGRELSQG